MVRTASIARGMLAILAVVASLVFAIALPAAASAAPTAAGAATIAVIPCPLADIPQDPGPVPTCPPCPPPCPPSPTTQPSDAIVCPLAPAAVTDAYPICPPPCPPPCPPLPSDPIVCPQPATSGGSPIIRPCTVSSFQNLGTGFCLDTDGSAVRKVFTVACSPRSRSQQWVFAGSNTTTTIHDLATGLCLTSNATGDVFDVSCLGASPLPEPHQWFVTQSGGPVIDTVTGRCLDSPPVPGPSLIPVETSQCNGTPLHNWVHK
ncbi:MAG: RICIN domain-containing protein [Pseudonocardiaceae bacterium]